MHGALTWKILIQSGHNLHKSRQLNCAKLWPDWITRTNIRVWIFFTILFRSSKLLVEWAASGAAEVTLRDTWSRTWGQFTNSLWARNPLKSSYIYTICSYVKKWPYHVTILHKPRQLRYRDMWKNDWIIWFNNEFLQDEIVNFKWNGPLVLASSVPSWRRFLYVVNGLTSICINWRNMHRLTV